MSLCLPPALPRPNRALNATLLPERAEECGGGGGGAGEKGAHAPGLQACWLWKTTEASWSCQARPAHSQALQLLPPQASPAPFLQGLRTC